MNYISTRNSAYRVRASEAIIAGLAPDGGLFLPEELPSVSLGDIARLSKHSYAHRAADILSRFLPEFSFEELKSFTDRAYSSRKFPVAGRAPVVKLSDSEYILELFHGPTCAFKDFALQMLPLLLTASLKKNDVKEEVVILVATSGDTGKAALEGFANVAGTKICVFFPHGGTSHIQRLQMTTQRGRNVMVAAVNGNFDDAQNGVKRIFTDGEYAGLLAERGCRLSSANSINWGRLVPQVAYYFSAYCDLISQGAIRLGDKINIAVPTGNFGNILAAYYAKHCGLPIRRFICASNKNNVLTDLIHTGVYDRNREFYLTTSPSMDILISSNLERLLYMLCGNDEEIRRYMQELQTTGRYTLKNYTHLSLQAEFDAGFADDDMAAQTIRTVFDEQKYLCDPHTAVGIKVYRDYRARTGDTTPTVIAATASPYKFPHSVLDALGRPASGDEFALLEQLEALNGIPVPKSLSELKTKQEIFTDVVAPKDMKRVVSALVERKK